jgi:YHS domain-containing protein
MRACPNRRHGAASTRGRNTAVRLMPLFGKSVTSARQQETSRRGAVAAVGCAAFAVAACLLDMAPYRSRVLAATTEWIVTDPRTGLAIQGFDPVSYFVDAAAAPGRAEFEYSYRGVVWRFRNLGNLAAFMEDPTGYAPQFGGYDPVAIGRGVPSPGNPLIWLIAGQKLYLFYSAQTQAAFKADVRRLLSQAAARWPDVTKALSQ